MQKNKSNQVIVRTEKNLLVDLIDADCKIQTSSEILDLGKCKVRHIHIPIFIVPLSNIDKNILSKFMLEDLIISIKIEDIDVVISEPGRMYGIYQDGKEEREDEIEILVAWAEPDHISSKYYNKLI